MINEIIEKRMRALPENVQRAIQNFPWAGYLMELAKRYHLQFDELEVVEREAKLYLVGLIDATEFERKLRDQLHLPEKVWSAFIQNLNESLFQKIQREAFRHEEERETSSEGVSREELVRALEQEGVKLVDEEESHTKPQTELQKLADELFGEKESQGEVLKGESEVDFPLENEEGKGESGAVEEQTLEPVPREMERVEEEDLEGIHMHRTPVSDEARREKLQSRLARLGATAFFSQEKKVSLSSKDAVKSEGRKRISFLKKIGAQS